MFKAVLAFALMGVSAFFTHPETGDITKKNRYISFVAWFGNNPSTFHTRVMVDSAQVNDLNGTGPWWANDPVSGLGGAPQAAFRSARRRNQRRNRMGVNVRRCI